MRKYFIDNLRWIAVLLLFPYHTFMIYNNWGEGFYIRGEPHGLLSKFIQVCWPWFMPLLFVIAGTSTCYALKKRTSKEYIKERFSKLFIPLVSGILLLIPVQTYYAEKFHNEYTGGYFAQYILFFTKETDLSGYTGGFTPGQLWFILYLFIISMIAAPFISWYQKNAKKILVEKLSVFKLLFMFLIPLILSPILNISGKSLGEYFALFMLGYLILSDDTIQIKLDTFRWYLFAGFITCVILILVVLNIWNAPKIFYDIFSRFYGWLGILSLLGLGRHYLNFHNKLTSYFSNAFFPVYIFHQSCLVLVAYYTFKVTSVIFLQVLVIMFGSFILTMVVYEICKQFSLTRLIFGAKK